MFDGQVCLMVRYVGWSGQVCLMVRYICRSGMFDGQVCLMVRYVWWSVQSSLNPLGPIVDISVMRLSA